MYVKNLIFIDFCKFKEMRIFSPQGDLLGVVEQEWTMLIPSFLIRDFSGRVIFVIEGPTYVPFRDYTGTDFKVSINRVELFM